MLSESSGSIFVHPFSHSKKRMSCLQIFSPTLWNLTKKHTIPHYMDTHFCTHSFVQQTESNQRWNYQVFCEVVVFQLCKQHQCRWACGWMRVFMCVIRSRWNNDRAWTQVKAREIFSKLCTADRVILWYNKKTSGETKIWQHLVLELFPANPNAVCILFYM